MIAGRRPGGSDLKFALTLVFTAWLLVSGDLAAYAAGGRPPLPPGGREIAPDTSSPCTTAEIGSQGYYFSDRAQQWVAAPFCYGKWGNLDASGSQIVAAGASVTVRAIPNGGSNSSTYAPQLGLVRWEYPGKKVSGVWCKGPDLHGNPGCCSGRGVAVVRIPRMDAKDLLHRLAGRPLRRTAPLCGGPDQRVVIRGHRPGR